MRGDYKAQHRSVPEMDDRKLQHILPCNLQSALRARNDNFNHVFKYYDNCPDYNFHSRSIHYINSHARNNYYNRSNHNINRHARNNYLNACYNDNNNDTTDFHFYNFRRD
uniref:Uncharacterized protein n=1 Tax=Plectus sambesii TaxID=2011161 RepID=A0A914WJU0_9BILA